MVGASDDEGDEECRKHCIDQVHDELRRVMQQRRVPRSVATQVQQAEEAAEGATVVG